MTASCLYHIEQISILHEYFMYSPTWMFGLLHFRFWNVWTYYHNVTMFHITFEQILSINCMFVCRTSTNNNAYTINK